MGYFSEASKRTPKRSSKTFRNDDVYVAKSKLLNNTELGLFANRDYDAGDIIQEYKGKNISDEDAENKTRNRKYMFEVRRRGNVVHVIDAANSHTSSAVRFVNTSLKRHNKQQNSEFKQYALRIYLVATKQIPKHTEFVAYYGDNTFGVLNEK
jgi:hypothetical protein